MTEEEEFFAWLDGELAPDAAAIVAARVAADPQLQRLADEHRSMQAELRSAFDPVMNDVPANGSNVVVMRSAANDNRGLLRYGAMAASMAIALLVGIQIGKPGEDSLFVSQNGQLIAAAALDDTLNDQLASAQQGEIRVGLSFKDSADHYCRSFIAPEAAGLACRDGNSWRVEGLFAGTGEVGEYRMAAGTDPRLAELIDDMIVGEPLDADEEAAARKEGWR